MKQNSLASSLTSEDLQKRIVALPGYQGLCRIWQVIPSARLVGGCVRDILAGRIVQDIDLASPLSPEGVIAALQKAGIRTVPTGLAHGTITALMPDQGCGMHHYEITTLRRDVETDGRHAVVAWTRDWEEDAARRDFTINALSLSADGQVYDYFGGLEDLYAKRVRFVGNAQKRIEEDALRALRFFRFQARYGTDPVDFEACKAIIACRVLIKNLSAERIAAELFKILSGPSVMSIITLMDETGVLEQCLPVVDVRGLQELLACGHQILPEQADQVLSGLVLRLFALSPDVRCGSCLRLSNAACAHISALAAAQPVLKTIMDDDALRRLLACHSLPVLHDRSWLAQRKGNREYGVCKDETWRNWRERMMTWPQPVFPITGRDIMVLGLQAGPEIGAWLKKTKEWWLAEGCRPSSQDCLEWLGQQIGRITGV